MTIGNETTAGLVYRLGVRFQGELDVATLKEVALYAADLSIGTPKAEEHSFNASGVLFGISKARKLRKLSSQPVDAVITLKEIDKFSVNRSFYPPFNDCSLQIEGLANCNFGHLQPYGKYAGLVELVNSDGLLRVSHEALSDQQTTRFDLSMDFRQL